MRPLRKIMDRQAKLFGHGGPLERLHPLFEATDTFLYSPGKVTRCAPHVRDGLDLKRMMSVVVFALFPCILMAMYNTGYQANLVFAQGKLAPVGWRADVIQAIGVGFAPDSLLACFMHGGLYFIPVLLMTYAAGGAVEVLFAIVRRHEVNEGFFVTGMLLPLIVPPAIPLWQVAVAVIFAVIFAKEVFGGTGMNIFNPALVARAFLFFAYPGQISGDAVWVAVDGYSGPTMLALAKGLEAGSAGGAQALMSSGCSWWDCFVGFIPGSMGETSVLACLIGAIILLITQIASWRVMLGVVVGTLAMSLTFNALAGHVRNPAFTVPFHWHVVLGGWAFGTVFMATDPVSSAYTERGKLIYGLGIGIMVILIRVVNPAYPEGMMLAILFMNVFAPLIDYFVLQANVKRRLARNAAV
ncbi:MAG TPA: NADH:ubiquinone reductase (Na(+)-transporting) subunit B [Phycisphaerae bacterium]|nr:NADH:ubiquinone reductase (Na(+)-transporting) subunit B [Phycisphaerae bacterium]